MVFDHRTAYLAEVRTLLSIPLIPLQYAVSEPVEWVHQLRLLLSRQDKLLQENMQLKAEQLLLKAKVQRLLAIESENNQLKALSHLSYDIKGRVLIAQILSINLEPFMNEILLNKGSHDHVYVGQPVLDTGGLLGKVIQVTPFTSRVLLIHDARNGLSVQVIRNGLRVLAVGDGYSGHLHLVGVQKTVDIRANDVLVTSGLGEDYPEGYPVGHVVRVLKDPGLQFSTILIEPFAHFDRLRQVVLVWPNEIHAADKT